MKNILITGGSGFIGRSIISKLDQYRFLSIDKSGNDTNVYMNVNSDISDISDEKLQEYLEWSDVIIHLAAEKLNNNADNQVLFNSNVNATFRLCNLLLKINYKNKKFIFTSSLYAYGNNGSGGEKFNEDDVVGNFTLYGTSKYISERVVQTLLYDKVDYFMIRLFFAYGPMQLSSAGYKSIIRKSVELLESGEPAEIYGTGSATLDYIYIDDVIDFLYQILNNKINFEIVNLGSGQGVNVNYLVKKICQIYGTPTQYTYKPSDWTEGTYRVADIYNLHKLGWQHKVSLDDGLKKIIKEYI